MRNGSSALPCLDKKKTTANFQKSDLSCLDRKNFFVKSKEYHTRFLAQKHFFIPRLLPEKNRFLRFEKKRNLRVFPTSPIGKTQNYPWFPYWSQQKPVFLTDECNDSAKFSLEDNGVIIVCLDVKSFEIGASHTALVDFCCFSGYKNGEILRGEVGKTLRFRLISNRKRLFFSEGSCRVKKCFCTKKRV